MMKLPPFRYLKKEKHFECQTGTEVKMLLFNNL